MTGLTGSDAAGSDFTGRISQKTPARTLSIRCWTPEFQRTLLPALHLLGPFPLMSLRRSRELTPVCSPKVTHQLVADIVVVRDDRMTIWPDLARANLFGKALLDVLGYFSAPRRALYASGVDDSRANPARLRRG